MKIVGISVFSVDLPPRGGYNRTGPSTVVRIDTDEGLCGYGEVVSYTTGFSEASVAAVADRGNALIGQNPFHVDMLSRMMDALFAHDMFRNEISVAIDMALWDVMGHATGRPVCDLLGARYDEPVPLYEAVYVKEGDTPEGVSMLAASYRRRGYRHLMIKTGRDPVVAIERIEAACSAMQSGDIVIADAGGSWSLFDAIRIGRALERDLPVTLVIEQPCATLEECVAFREHCNLPVKLDELVDSPRSVLQIHRGRAAEICNLQMARIGGLTKARHIRDLCVDLGLTVVTQDRHGSDIVGAAVAHFAQSTDPAYLLNTFHFPSIVDIVTAEGCPEPKNGSLMASSDPGLGISVHMDVLGTPVATVGTSVAAA